MKEVVEILQVEMPSADDVTLMDETCSESLNVLKNEVLPLGHRKPGIIKPYII